MNGRRTLHDFQQKEYSQPVDLLDGSTRASLGEINRGESTRLLWNVIRRQPQLVLLGLRGLLMGTEDLRLGLRDPATLNGPSANGPSAQH